MAKIFDFTLVPTRQFMQVRRNKPSRRIAIFSRSSEMLDALLKGYILALTQGNNTSSYSWTVFSKHHTELFGKENEACEYVRSILEESEYDLVFCTGIFSTHVVKKTTEKYFPHIPVVFCLTATPEQYGFIESLRSSSNNLVGVEADHFPEIMYGQIFIKVMPHAKKVLIPYPKNEGVKVLEALALRYKDFFNAHGIEVNLLPLPAQKSPIAAIKNNIAGVDTVLFLTRAKFKMDGKAFDALCKEHQIAVVGGGDAGDVKSRAIFDFKVDVSGIGHHAGLLSRRIVEEQIAPSSLPTKRVMCPRKLVFNEDVLSEHGIELTDDFVASLEQDLLVRHKEIFLLPVLSPIEVNMFSDVVTGMCDHITKHIKEGDNYYFPYFCEISQQRPFDAICADVRSFLLSKNKQGSPQLIIALGSAMTHAAQEVMRLEKRKLPIISVISERLDPKTFAQIQRRHKNQERVSLVREQTAYICIEASSPLLPLQSLLEVAPQVRRITVLHYEVGTPFDPIKKALCAYGEQEGMEFFWEYATSPEELLSSVQQAAKEGCPVIFYEEFMHMRYAHQLCQRLSSLGVPLVAGGLECAPYGAALSLGVDNKAIGGEVFAYFRRVLDDNQSPLDLPPLFLKNYDVVINEKACQEQSIVLSDAQRLLYKCKKN